ncbi:hypothetical protein JD844_004988 [Phrynosoma platyrhinos]|uniref:Alpha-N-acetylgalactosaminide alpha-2,6-sialyltransferase 6 n=1 Tax=Phrynosoma platyrhinos TaxID=52577 RepID=A0ABQ7SE41_PHRPL|nr:hypothetical protein JD844_004988 [Phrynosoma platyrhinos]
MITSSSHLLGSKLGPVIDQAECVIRMNDAPTTGYAADVGNKTTFRVAAHSSLFRVLRKPQEFVNKTPENTLIFWGPAGRMQKILNKVIQRASLSFPNVRRTRARKMPYHYYEPKSPDECVTYINNEWSKKGYHHRFITEKRVFAKWASLYNITFSHPSWN